MAKLLIDVKCGEMTCGECDLMWALLHPRCTFWKGKRGRPRRLRQKDGATLRCPVCLAAEKRAKEAIECLRVQDIKFGTDDNAPAIRLLKVAGEVDKDRALSVLATLLVVYVKGKEEVDTKKLDESLDGGAIRELRVLIEAIPDAKEPK